MFYFKFVLLHLFDKFSFVIIFVCVSFDFENPTSPLGMGGLEGFEEERKPITLREGFTPPQPLPGPSSSATRSDPTPHISYPYKFGF